MTNLNHVEQVTVTLTLASGDQHTLTIHRPGPAGDNPRFLAQQIDAALEGLGERLHHLADMYAPQIRS